MAPMALPVSAVMMLRKWNHATTCAFGGIPAQWKPQKPRKSQKTLKTPEPRKATKTLEPLETGEIAETGNWAEYARRWHALKPNIVHDDPRKPQEQMDLDVEWAREVAAGTPRTHPCVFWEWAEPAVVIGRSSRSKTKSTCTPRKTKDSA